MVTKRCQDCGYKKNDVFSFESPCRQGEMVDVCLDCRERDQEGYDEQQAQYAEWSRDAEDACRGGLW
jgi:hypothetical protein